jgi:small-conductance mechanosensitive channel
VILFQGFFSFFVIIVIYRKREVLKGSKRWGFLAARPVSAGLFIAFMTTVLFYEYEGAPTIWKLTDTAVGGISFARLMGGLIGASWKRQFIYGLVIVLISSQAMKMLSFPLPVFRLYTALTTLVGLFFCLGRARECIRQKDSRQYAVPLRAGAVFFSVIIFAELWGKRALASYLFASLIDSIATVLVFMLFMYLIRGGLEWLFQAPLLRHVAMRHSGNTDVIVRRLSHFINVVIGGVVLLPANLMIWGVFESLEAAMKALMALGFDLDSQRISVGLLLTSAGILYGSYLISWISKKLLLEKSFYGRRMERGVRLSIGRLIHYAIMLIGFLLALSTLGFEVTKITILLSALGIGIGFGLQGIVNNFVSGLILLFERPVRVGDTIEIEGKWAEIKRIGLRATTVQTLDQADVVIPNADLVSRQVTNWTLSNRLVRLIIPVGVAYGSDVSLVMETLSACARDHEMVAAFRSPQVLFLSFGESSLDFELRIWVTDADNRLTVKSDLHREIDRRFREANIEIAFPQRDLHLRSVDKSAFIGAAETVG